MESKHIYAYSVDILTNGYGQGGQYIIGNFYGTVICRSEECSKHMQDVLSDAQKQFQDSFPYPYQNMPVLRFWNRVD